MTKHIAGLILFTFIVGTSAVITGLFYSTPDRMVAFSYSNERNSCSKRKRRHRKPKRPRVFADKVFSTGLNQAVFDTSTGLLMVSHEVRAVPEDETRSMLVYHFYVKDEYGTRHVKSEKIWSGIESSSVLNGFQWLSNRNSKENLYIGSEYRDYRDKSWRIAPKFEDSNAVPVLIKNGD